jgi:acetolactate synthase-1/2/3 large subunit
MTTAEAIIKRLEQHGVSHVFGIPGTHNLPLYRHLADTSITHVVTRHEQACAYAADGFARRTGRPAVCLTTTGPALFNAAAAIGTAWADSVPMIVLSPGLPDQAEGRDTGFLHESRSQQGVMRELVGQSHRVAGPLDAVRLIDAAFASFSSSRPRPFHLEVPLDAMGEDGGAPPDLPPPASPPAPDPGLLARAVSLLAAARQGVIVLGGGAAGAAEPARALARRLGMPVVTSLNGKGVYPEGDELSLGASMRLRSCHRLLREADVVLAVGTELAESDIWCEPPLELGGELIRIDIDPAQLHKNATAAVAVLADAGLALTAILEGLGESRPPGEVERVATARSELEAEALIEGREFVDLVAAIDRGSGPEAVIAADSAMACYYGVAHLLPQESPRRFLFPTGFATLGYGLPAAIGAKLAEPGRPVVAMLGDGGAMFTIAELATAVELRLGLPILVVDNGGYGEIERMMRDAEQPVLGTKLERPDFAALARSFGAMGERVEDLGKLPETLAAAFGRERPTLVELPWPSVD